MEAFFVRQDEDDDGRAVIGIGVGAHDGGVHLHQFVARGFIPDGDDHGRLPAHARGRPSPRFKDLVQKLFGDGVRLVSAHAAARFDILQNFSFHCPPFARVKARG